ncbi:hypothetical protein L2E82_20172 [Cichorium intybus]|uniref:Uncharacterized protein n=1 Tax=Cichorium intybus TaxID=13427 RepID=A0ACB9DSA0_CICIN|nr:hypothetical protein L2E82_20172 [Cichorium intybus]
MQVVSLRGSNLFEWERGGGLSLEEKWLVLLFKFFSMNKPKIFKSGILEEKNPSTTQENEELESSEDDDIPSLEANTNRRRLT